ncbi:MAG: hypothetical protein EU539_03240 [Promethearchaeota archaeon]|nr:MAG: hypothetical protein EU539_03240 [Candidatus Lokiarchaeota archaeon]
MLNLKPNQQGQKFPIRTGSKRGKELLDEAYYSFEGRSIQIIRTNVNNSTVNDLLDMLQKRLTTISSYLSEAEQSSQLFKKLEGKYPIKFVNNLEFLAEIAEHKIIFSIEAIKQPLDDVFFEDIYEALQELYSLIQVYEICHLAGINKWDAMHLTASFYLGFIKSKKKRIFKLLRTLRKRNIDDDSLFYVFLKELEHVNTHYKGNDLILRIDKKISWLFSHLRFSHPYNLKRLQEILRSDIIKDEKTKLLLDEVFAKGKYDEQAEQQNALTLSLKLLKEGKFLTVSRHSRASFFLVVLASGAKLLLDIADLQESHSRIKEILRRIETIEAKNLKEVILNGAYGIEATIRKLQILSLGEKIRSFAQVIGRYKEIRKNIDSFEMRVNDQIMEIGRRKRDPLKEIQLNEIRQELFGYLNRIRKITLESETLLRELDYGFPNSSILIQRASQTGVRALSWICLGENPFEAEEQQIEVALKEGAMNLWASPDNVWFKMANFWIEALPLYIHKERDELKGERVIIEQETMEEVFKNYLAIDWKDNIDLAMLTEHLSLARHYTCEFYPELWGKKKALTNASGMSEEDVEYQVIESILPRNNKWENIITKLAVIIEKTWRNLRYDIAEKIENDNSTRYQALYDVIENSGKEANLINLVKKHARTKEDLAHILDQIVSEEDKKLENTSLVYRLKNRIPEYEKYINWPRREYPTWIILTTQAAGMSAVCAANWVEETMSMKALMEDLQFKGNTLEKEARMRADEYEKWVHQITKMVINDFGLEYILEERQYRDVNFNEWNVMKEIIRVYPEVAREVAKILMINEMLDPNLRTYNQDPQIVNDYMKDHDEELNRLSLSRVRQENIEVRNFEDKKILQDKDYLLVVENYKKVFAREHIIESVEPKHIRNILIWYVSKQSEMSLPRILRYRLKGYLGLSTARYEILSQYKITSKGKLIQNDEKDAKHAILLRNDPVYDYASHGKNKKYNRGYGPSRVDLGLFERRSVEEWAQWIGPVDHFSMKAMINFYELYNQNVHAFNDVREAETMKPFENMMMEASLALSHLSMALIQAIGIGDFYGYAYQTNSRPEVFIRLGGGGSAGFCQPKDIYFLPFVVGLTLNDALEFAGIGAGNWSTIEKLYQKLKGNIEAYFDPSSMDEISDFLDKAISSRQTELKNSKIFSESHLLGAQAFSISGSLHDAIQKIGFGLPQTNSNGFTKHLIGKHFAEVFELLEGRMRFSDIVLAWQIRKTIEKVRERRLERGKIAPHYNDALIVFPVEYKPVGDPRLSTGSKLKDLMTGLGAHLLDPFGNDGKALADLLLKGFDKDNDLQIQLIARGLGKRTLNHKEIKDLEEIYPEIGFPGDIRLVSPFGLTRDAVFNYVAGAELDRAAEQARSVIGRYLKDNQINANILSYGPDLERWLGLTTDQRNEIRKELNGKIYALVWDVRLQDPEYRNRTFTDLWESIRGSDVFCIFVHYTELTGPEDIDKTDEKSEFMLEDLARIRDTMLQGNPNSALIIVDAPVQGRKPVFDPIAIKSWYGLGGTFLSPSIGEETLLRYKNEMLQERNIATRFYKAVLSEDINGANLAFKELKSIAHDRYREANLFEEFAQMGRERFRGGGFLNYGQRHRLYRQGWSKMLKARHFEEIDFNDLLIAGMSYDLNGKPREDIETAYSSFNKAMKKLRKKPFIGEIDEEKTAAVKSHFVRPKYIEPVKGKIEAKGERSSIKSRDIDTQNVEGKAKAMARERKRVSNIRLQRKGFKFAMEENIVQDGKSNFIQFYHKAKAVLGSGKELISYEQFGRFIGYSYRAYKVIIENIVRNEQSKKKFLANMEELYNDGLGYEQEKWRGIWNEIMGEEDDIGDIGRMALLLEGNKDELSELALLAELLDILLAFILTFEYQFEDNGKLLSDQVFSSIQLFFSMTVYDHVMDYPPRWIMPSESGPGFTDYDFIMGKWMRPGKPFTRREIIEIAVKTHEWLKKYLSNLTRTKTWFKNLNSSEQDLLIGSDEILPIGAGKDCYEKESQQWFAYCQLRELSYLDRDGHRISWAADNISAKKLSRGKPFCVIATPIGRTHLTCYLAENPKFNKEYPDHQVIWVLTRSIKFGKKKINENKKDVLMIYEGLMYLSIDEFRKLLLEREIPIEEIETRVKIAIRTNPDGILVALRFREPPIACFSMPFHGWTEYQKGIDEKIGIPTGQEWISNHWMYDKTYETLIHPEGCGVLLPEETQWYMSWQYEDFEKGIRRDSTEVLQDIINGNDNFIGLKNLPWIRVIAKASRQSGGRGSKAMQLRNYKGDIIMENVTELAEHVMMIGWVDNQVIQRTLPASPRLWASKKYLERLRRGLVNKGIPAPEYSDFFSYVRIIIIRDQQGNDMHVLPLVVTSRATISNVGRGGILFELLPDYFLSPEQFKLFLEEMKRVASRSLELTEVASESLVRKLKNDQSVDDASSLMKERILVSLENGYQDLTGWKYTKPRYMMFDMIPLPILIFNGMTLRRPEILEVRYDNEGKISHFIVLDLEKMEINQVSVKTIIGWDMVLIENNVGYGLWYPFKEDQKMREYKRAKIENDEINPFNWGKDLRKIMYGFSTGARAYYEALHGKSPKIVSLPEEEIIYPLTSPIVHYEHESVQKEKELRGVEGIFSHLTRMLKNALNPQKIIRWRNNWREDSPIAIFNEISNYYNKNQGNILRKLATLTELTDKELKNLLDEEYLEKIYADLCDSIFTERLVPEVRKYPESYIPDNIEDLLDGFRFAFIFDGYLGRLDDIYTLVHSAFIANERRDKSTEKRIIVLGVNKNWINSEAKIKRALVFDFNKEILIETDLPRSFLPDKIGVRYLNQNEIDEHRKLSSLYLSKNVPQLNPDIMDPKSGAAKADDKWETTIAIKDHVSVPHTIYIERNMDLEKIEESLRDFLSQTTIDSFYLQVALGTEGEGIEKFKYDHNFEKFLHTVQKLSKEDKLIIREEVGNIRYQKTRKISFRINVSFKDNKSFSESFFCQVGASGSPVSSVSQGGEIIPFTRLEEDLYLIDEEGNLTSLSLTRISLEELARSAEKALEGLNMGLSKELSLEFAGIDIEVEIHPTHIKYYVLDINPRPAGLRHSMNLRNLTEILPSRLIFEL